MAMLWFVLALIFLAAALVVFRLDKRQKGGDGPARGAGTPPALGDGTDGGVAAGGARPAPFAEPAPVDDGRQGLDRQGLDSGAGPDEVTRPAPGSEPAPGPSPWSAPVAPGAPAAGPQDAYPAGGAPYVGDRPHDSATDFHGSTEPDAGHDSDSDGRFGAPAAAAGAAGAGAAAAGPSLMGRVRGLLPGRGGASESRGQETGADARGVAGDPDADTDTGATEHDPLAGSPVVRWLEDRDFRPSTTGLPAPRHGEFAAGVPAPRAASIGVFRGRRALMAVAAGSTVFALRGRGATDAVIDLSRPDVDPDAGLDRVGTMAGFELRSTDSHGIPDPVDREHLERTLFEIPDEVRRVWTEGEWTFASVDGTDDIGVWDDTVVALVGVSDTFAALPPAGGRARAIPAGTDPGAPGAASGPEVDPAVGMDGTSASDDAAIEADERARAESDERVRAEAESRSAEAGQAPPAGSASRATGPVAEDGDTPATQRTVSIQKIGDEAPGHEGGHAGSAVDGTAGDGAANDETATDGAANDGTSAEEESGDHGRAAKTGLGAAVAGAAAAGLGALRGRRQGHLRVVEEESDSVRSLSDEPVRPDAGDDGSGSAPQGERALDPTGAAAASEAAPAAEQQQVPEPAPEPEPSPFDAVMDPSAPVPSRGDVASDYLEPRPPLPRPSRAGSAHHSESAVPPLGAGAGEAGIKPLGSEDDADEIRSEVERFDAARLDGGSDFADLPQGRHYGPEADADAGSTAGGTTAPAWSAAPAPAADEGEPTDASRAEDHSATESVTGAAATGPGRTESPPEPAATEQAATEAEPDTGTRSSGGGRHRKDASGAWTPTVSEGSTGGGRRRRAEPDDEARDEHPSDTDPQSGTGRRHERSAVEPDLEETTRFRVLGEEPPRD